MRYFLIFLFHLFSIVCMSQQIIDNGIIYVDGHNNRYTLSSGRWFKNQLSYYIASTSTQLTDLECKNAIEEAFNVWESVSNFEFAEVNNVSDCDILIKWVTGYHGDSSPFLLNENTLAHTLGSSGANNNQREIHFNDYKNWTVNGNDNDVTSVAMHEIGHVLGLDHSDVSYSVMSAFYNYRTFLCPDDSKGLWAIYGCPFGITGPSILCNTNAYNINRLPSTFNTAWSFSGDCASLMISRLTTGYPNNQCVVDNSIGYQLNNLSLIATITQDGDTLTTLAKSVCANRSYLGSYSQTPSVVNQYGYPTIPETAFDFFSNGFDFNEIVVNPECNITLKCPRFKHMDFSTFGLGCNINRVDDETIILWPYRPTGLGGLITITASGNGNCNDFSFYINVQRAALSRQIELECRELSGNLVVSISPSSELMSQMIDTREANLNIMITEVLTGIIIFSQEITNTSISIPITGWRKGIYSIYVSNDEECLTRKIAIR